MTSIGERIKSRRKELGISADQLAKTLNKNRATIYRYESDEIENMPTTVLEPLAEALYTTPAFLMGWEVADDNLNEYEKMITSINMENIIKYQLADGQISDNPDYIINHLKNVLNNRLDEDYRYTTNQLYFKFYGWLIGKEKTNDIEADYLAKVLTNDGELTITDDEIFYDVLTMDMSLNKIINDESKGVYGSRYYIALNYERDLKIELLKEKFNSVEKNIIRQKLSSIQEIIQIFSKEYDFLKQYNAFVTNLKKHANNYKNKYAHINSNILSQKDHFLLKKYRSLDEFDKKAVDDLLDTLASRKTEQAHEFIAIEPSLVIPYYGKLASAGTGQFIFDDIPPEMITIENTDETIKANYAIGVNGDSMEPTYSDGQIVLVNKLNKIDIGEIGIFMIDGEAFVKELGEDVLISHNKTYSDILINESTICLGKVLGKI